jgi:hypothetical protein
MLDPAGQLGAGAIAGLIGPNKPLHWTAEYRSVRVGLVSTVLACGANSGGQSSAASERRRSA